MNLGSKDNPTCLAASFESMFLQRQQCRWLNRCRMSSHFLRQALRCRCEGNLLRMGPVALGDPEIGQEAPALGIFDQMQNAREEVALGFGAADIDDTCVLEFVIKEP